MAAGSGSALRRWAVVVVGVLLAAAGLGSWKYAQIQAAMAAGAAFGEPVEAVEVVTASPTTWQPTTAVTGQVVAVRAVEVVNELAGRVVAVGFRPGAEVAEGQVLLRQDVAEEQAQLAAAEAEAELARLALARAERLVASGTGTEELRDQARARHDAAQALVARLAAVVDKKTLRAPFAARAGLHELEAGQYLEAGTPITRLIGLGELVWVDFTLPQEQATLVPGDPVQILRVGPGPALPGATVVGRDAFVDRAARQVRFRAELPVAPEVLPPGSLVRVQLAAGAPRTAALVPAAAVRHGTFGASVFVLEPAGAGAAAAERATRRPVDVAGQEGELVVVTAGLEAGERVAANGAFKLRDGVLVQAVVPDGA